MTQQPSDKAMERAKQIVTVEQQEGVSSWLIKVRGFIIGADKSLVIADSNAWTLKEMIARTIDEAVAEERARYEQAMPCGHAQRYAVHSDGGTGYCALCELHQARLQLDLCKSAVDELESQLEEARAPDNDYRYFIPGRGRPDAD